MLPDLEQRKAALSAEQRAEFERRLKGNCNRPEAGIQPASRSSAILLSYAQERVWLHEELVPGSLVHNRPANIRLRGPLNVSALRQALNHVVQRHEALRTRIVVQDGEARQQIEDTPALDLPITDVSSEFDADVQVRQLVLEIARRSFDLQTGQLLHARLVRIAAEDHLLLLTFHHFAFDAWSHSILVRELADNYKSVGTGQAPSGTGFRFNSPITLPGRGGHHVCRSWREFASFWKQSLLDPPVLQLPTDVSHPVHPDEAAGQVGVRVPSNLATALRDLARDEHTTLFAALLAGFTMLLHRYSQQEDIIVGCPIAGRSRVETENLIGVFINMLPLRTKLVHGSTFRQLIRQIRDTTIDALQHQDVPFQQIVQDVLTNRDPGIHPLFQSLFIYENFVLETRSAANISFEPQNMAPEALLVDLSLELGDSPNGIEGYLCFRKDLWEVASIERMAGNFLTILEAAVFEPDRPLETLPIMTERERHQLLVEWNNTTTEYPREKCLHELFEAQVERTPDAIAIIADEQELTYRKLNERANRLAHHLRSQGVEPEVMVGLCLKRSIDLLVSILGVLKAGGAYVPLDPEYPRQRLEFMLQDAAIGKVITTNSLLQKLPEGLAHSICIDSIRDVLASQSSGNPIRCARPENAAYLIYTSGSTGKPKGVLVEHRNVVNCLTCSATLMSLQISDRFVGFAPPTFDISVAEMFLPLCVGGVAILADRDLIFDRERLVQEIRKRRPQVIQATPASWELLAGYNGWGGPELTLITIGEALTNELASRLLTKCGRLWNMYGPTETTIWSTGLQVTTPKNSIGRPIGNTKVYVLDGERNLAPIGIWGELYIGGDGLARGYLNRPDLTAERFIANPFDADPGSRLYRTGDRVRWRAEGTLEFQGRLDNQVKLRGYRIELGEIEAAMREHAGVGQCAAVVREDGPDDKRVIAYWVPENSDDEISLRDYLLNRLPNYMVPSAFVRMKSLPLTPSGKLDRKSLPAPDVERIGADTKSVAIPQTDTERIVADVWQSALKINQVSIHDDFFELGGHSILAARMCIELEKRLGRRVPLASLFAAPTIHRLAKEVALDQLSQHAVAVVPLQPLGSRSPLFLMPSLSGSPLSWKDLLEELSAEQPVFAIGLAGEHPPWGERATLREIASHFVSAIRDSKVDGPIHIMGHSFGGMLAYEVACQLHDAEVAVGRVLVVDTGPEQVGGHSRATFLRNLGRCCLNAPPWIWQFITKTSLSQKLYEVRRSFRAWSRQVIAAVNGRQVIKELDEAVDTRSIPEEFRKRMETNYNAFKSYVPGTFSGHIVLFRARMRPLLRGFTPDLNWGKVVTGVLEVIDIPGNHGTILQKPNINILAQQLQTLLDMG